MGSAPAWVTVTPVLAFPCGLGLLFLIVWFFAQLARRGGMTMDPASPRPLPPNIPPMSAERFQELWEREVSDSDRNWTADLPAYRDLFMYLMGLRTPHFARLAIPPHLQPVLIAIFLENHHIYVGPTASGRRVRMTIWRPAHAGEDHPGK